MMKSKEWCLACIKILEKFVKLKKLKPQPNDMLKYFFEGVDLVDTKYGIFFYCLFFCYFE